MKPAWASQAEPAFARNSIGSNPVSHVLPGPQTLLYCGSPCRVKVPGESARTQQLYAVTVARSQRCSSTER